MTRNKSQAAYNPTNERRATGHERTIIRHAERRAKTAGRVAFGGAR